VREGLAFTQTGCPLGDAPATASTQQLTGDIAIEVRC
jgi:hypothetical protein